jgi:hypothetical protein
MHAHDISALIALKFFAYKNGSEETKTIIAKTIIAIQSGGGYTEN